MKRETLRHPKLYELAAKLGCDRPTALGYLALLWDYTGEVAPQGNIGKWTDGAIALACDWAGDPAHFAEAMVCVGWLDRSEPHRLIIHDWPDHCEQWVKKKLDRAEQQFLAEYSHCPAGGRPLDALSNPIQSNPIQSNPIQSNPIQSKPIQSNPTGPVSDESEPTAAASSAGSAVYAFPLASSAGQPDWELPAAKLAEYRESYPHFDVDAELRKARQWLRDNPAKRKTGSRGTLSFLTRWLNRVQDRGGGRAAQQPAKPKRSTAEILGGAK